MGAAGWMGAKRKSMPMEARGMDHEPLAFADLAEQLDHCIPTKRCRTEQVRRQSSMYSASQSHRVSVLKTLPQDA